MRRRGKEIFQEHYDYMQSVIPTLLEAEQTIDRIKSSKEWKRSFNYFQTLYNRGQLKERPTKANGYKIETGGNLVCLADIEDILTPEQLELIKTKTL